MESTMYYGEDYQSIPATSRRSGKGIEVTSDVYVYTVQFANIYLIANPLTDEFVLVDAGTPNSSEEIIAAVEKRFGKHSRPKAIILTHGHFDHVGSVIELVNHWQVPVYAHALELPYLTGKKNYPKGDFRVEGGLVAKISPLFPVDAINLGSHVQALPFDETVPYLPDFKWIHVPGHTEGQIALFREKDRLLIAADAFVTTQQESLYQMIMQKKELHGPPRYLTTDWLAAKESVRKLALLEPHIAVTGHGLPMEGNELTENLRELADRFEELAVPKHGKFVGKNKK